MNKRLLRQMVIVKEKITNLIKLSQNENPLGPSPLSVKAVQQMTSQLHLYPGSRLEELRNKLADRYGVSAANVALSAGSVEMMDIIIKVFAAHDEEILTSEITFPLYGVLSRINKRKCVFAKMDRLGIDIENIISSCRQKTRVIFVANPNNPTGTIITHQDLEKLLQGLTHDTIIVIDEAYAEYVTDKTYPDSLSLQKHFPNLVVLRTFSKIYGLGGMRIGYAIAQEDVVKLLEESRIPFSITDFAVVAAISALDDEEYVRSSVSLNSGERTFIYSELKQLGYSVELSQGNFLFIGFDTIAEKNAFYQQLLRKGILVRELDAFGVKNALRVSIGTRADNRSLIECLKSSR